MFFSGNFLRFSLENQICIGKFAIDLEVCCHESSPAYPVVIPVFVRGHISSSSSSSSQVQSFTVQNQQLPRSRPHSRTSGTPSGAVPVPEEQSSTTGKKTSRPRKSSTASQGGIVIAITGAESDSQSVSQTGK